MWLEDLLMPDWLPDTDVCWFSFPITCYGDRGKLVDYLEKHGTETRSMFAGNITLHPAYRHSKFRISGKLTEANYILKHSFWISTHPRLKKSDLDYIINELEKKDFEVEEKHLLIHSGFPSSELF